jgi:two-component system NtrC family sensor kinase
MKSGSVPHAAGLRLPAWRWLAAAGFAAATMAVRAALDPWLGSIGPFALAFVAVAASALLAGTGPALLAVAICALAPQLPAMPPLFGQHDPRLPTAVFIIAAVLMVLMMHWLTRRPPLPSHASAAPQAEQVLAAQGRHVQVWLRLLVVMALLLPTAFFVTAAWHARRSTYDAGEERVTRGAIIAREHALKVMHVNELIFDLLRSRYDGAAAQSAEAVPPLEGPEVREALKRIDVDLTDVDAISAWTESGALLVASDGRNAGAVMNHGERECFAALAAGGPEPCISAPFSVASGGRSGLLVFARRRDVSPGRFGGMYAITLDLASFETFYSELLRSEHSGAVTLFRADGLILVREPQPGQLGMQVPHADPLVKMMHGGHEDGMMTMTSVVDHGPRLLAFRKVAPYPLYAVVSISHHQMLDNWFREMALLAAFTFPSALALAWVSWLSLQHTRRERLALERWRDETVRRAQAEDALRQSQRLEALGHLTGGVAHDVNNLLMVVSNNAYLLKRLIAVRTGNVEPRVAKPIDAILRAVTTGARLTRQLLAFARQQALRPEVICLQDRLQQLVDLMRHSVSSTVAVSGQVAPDTHCIEVDPAELELALINLAVNARDAMPDGGRLSVEVRNAHPDEHEGLGDWVIIAVSDTGSGIAAELLEHVFEPFFTTKPQGAGTGLGLSQVYGFCQQAGGIARISSRLGEGTTVRLLLPGVDQTPTPAEESPPVPAAQGRLLLVEDNVEVAEATEPMLSSWGYQVRAVTSGDSARELLDQAEGGFELLLTDIVMPGSTDGLSLARYVRTRYPQVGIVLMTGHARETDKAMGEGFVVLQKPWTPQALAEALEQAHPAKRAPRTS